MGRRLLVIGGDAAGMSAASQALRRATYPLDTVVVERGHWTSYSACGIPYWIAGDVERADNLVARTAKEHRARGIDVRLGVTATEIDLDRQRVQVLRGSAPEWLDFDDLVIGTGARPIRPDLPGVDADGVLGVQNLDEGQRVLDVLCGAREVQRAVVVGAGYIGVEMAEALCARGLDVTVVQRGPEPMTSLDSRMGAHIRAALNRLGAQVVCGAEATGFDSGADGWVTGVVAGGATYPADLVVLGIGVAPAAEIATRAGLPTGASGGIRTDDRMAVAEGVWAGGDCVEVWHRVSRQHRHLPLGTHANKQGRVIGINVTGGDTTGWARFPGAVGTAITRVGDLEVARTGLTRGQAAAAGFQTVSETVETTTIAGYMPGSEPMHVLLVAECGTGRLLGAEIVGGRGAAKRIDVCAMALWQQMTVAELAMTDLAYAPPFSSVWDPVQVAAWKVAGSV
ncbi:MAG TPA: FAD-dependent oxidoreductase [Nocardioidaceae bacterium]|nr:FAD-dependent oxidoreductase [Nocardioidaceae bacterium]